MKSERWKPVFGFEILYKISNHGRVESLARNTSKGKILISTISNSYYRVCLCKNGVKYYKSIHRLVAAHFRRNKNNYKIVNHLDGDTLNNYYKNLEWTTSSGNKLHSVNVLGRKTGYSKGENHLLSKLTNESVLGIRERYNNGESVKYIAAVYGIKAGYLYDIISNKRWKHI